MTHLLALGRALDLATIALVAFLRPAALAGESNPLMAWSLAHGGLWAVLLAQVALTAVLLVLVALAASQARTAGRRRVLAILVGLTWVGAASNVRGLM